MVEIRKAERRMSKLRLGIAGPAGSGKTFGALRLAKGLGGKVCIIDTENGSGDLYAHLFDYSVIALRAPYAPKYYVEAIKATEGAGYDVIIIDSLSHAWAGDGGLLDQVDKKAGQGNSFSAWRDATPQHNQLVDAMLNSTCHIIGTMRSKTAYDMEEYTDSKGNRKTKPVKLGMAPVQREGMDYEFTVMIDVNREHFASVSKDRTNMFSDEVFQISEDTGKRLLKWLGEGKVDDAVVKKQIFNMTEFLGIPSKDPAVYKQEVEKLTELELIPANYGEIVKRLQGIMTKPAVQAMPKDLPY